MLINLHKSVNLGFDPRMQNKGVKMKYVMLCGGKKCCPIVGIPTDAEKYVTITDDFGGSVKLTKEQMKLLKKEI